MELLFGLASCDCDSLTAAQVQACRHPIVHPGPCKGWKGPNSPTARRLRKPVQKKGTVKKLTPEEVKAREDRIEQAVNDNFSRLATIKTQRNPDGSWKPERDRMHREIVEAMYAKAKNVPRDGKAIIAGGLGGSGKSTVLRDHAGVKPGEYFTVNSDDIKEEMAKRGMIPGIDGHEDLAPMERVGLIHQESSRISEMLADRAYADRRNMIWDLTMSHPLAVQPQIDDLRRAGYDEIKSVFVDIPAAKSLERAMSRYREGLSAWERGEGLGGRFVPPGIIRSMATPSGGTINREVFDEIKDQFDDWSVYDNSVDGRAPRVVERKRG